MAGVTLTAVNMSLVRSGLFLLLIAIFSFYNAFTGYRVLYRKKPDERAALLDWAATGITLLGSLALIGHGIYLLLHDNYAGIVAIVFGLVGTALAGFDVYRYLRPDLDKRAWWFAHMNRMLGAYIATVTAFSVVNFTFLPGLVRWLWPTVVGVVAVNVWVRYYRRQFARKDNARRARLEPEPRRVVLARQPPSRSAREPAEL